MVVGLVELVVPEVVAVVAVVAVQVEVDVLLALPPQLRRKVGERSKKPQVSHPKGVLYSEIPL